MPRGERGTSRPYLRGKTWWIRYQVPGEQKERRESSGSAKKSDAVRLLHNRLKDIDDRTLAPGKPTVGQLLQLYLADQRRQGRKSYRQAEGYVRLHLDPVFGKCPVDDLTSQMINAFIDQKLAKPYKKASVNQFLRALRRSFNLGLRAKPPLVHVAPHISLLTENNVREGFLSDEEYHRLRNLLPYHQQMLLVLGYHWGMRKGELVKLRWDQVDWSQGLVRLERNQTKGKQARVAPIYGDLPGWLDLAYAARTCETIIEYAGHPIIETKTAWHKGTIEAGLPGLHVHDLRRTAVRNMVRAGIPEKQAMLISGHKTKAIFMRYDIVDESDIQNAGRKLDAYFKAAREMQSSHKVRTNDGNREQGDLPQRVSIQ